jgi:hypothetical protein
MAELPRHLGRGQVLGKMRRLGLKTKNAANPKNGRRQRGGRISGD